MQKLARSDVQERRALAALAHPVSVGALVLWLVNDHAWKAQHGNWFTGKLSDVAGLIVFPLLVATALAWWVRRPMGWGIAITTAVYGSVNLSATADTAMESVATIVAPAQLTRDPTDLLLLPVLAVPTLLWRGATERATRRSWAHMLFALGVATTLATSSPDISTERYTGTLVLDRTQPIVRIPVVLDDRGRVLDPSPYVQIGRDLTAFGRGGINVGRGGSLVEAKPVSTDDGWHVEYRLLDPNTDAAPIEVRWTLWATADGSDDRVSDALRLSIVAPEP